MQDSKTKGFFDGIVSKLTEELKNIFSTEFIYEDLKKFDEVSSSISRNILQGRDAAFGIRQAFAEASVYVARMGGDIEDVQKIQQGILESTQRNLVVTDKDVYEKLYAAQQLTEQGAGRLLKTYKDIGISTYDASQNVQKGVDRAREMGVNVASVFDKITSNLSKINEYNFQNGVEGFSKMAAKATALRVDMSTTLGVAEKVLNPEGAIEMANAFQRLGVGTSQLLDPLRLMDLSMNDPEELQNQLAKMTEQFTKFNAETGRFEILPGAKRMLRELSTATGINYQELTKMSLASAELSDKLSKIKFPEFANKEQQEMIANLAEMKGGQYVVQVQEKDKEGKLVTKEKAITELQKEDMQKLIDANKGKDMVELTKESMDVTKSINADVRAIKLAISGGLTSSKIGEDMLSGTAKAFSKFEKSLSTNLVNVKAISENTDEFAGAIKKLIKGELSIPEAFGLLGEKAKKLGGNIGQVASDLEEIAKEFPGIKELLSIKAHTIKKEEDKTQSTTKGTPKKSQDLIISDKGVFEPSENDIIVAADKNKKNVSITPKSIPEIMPQSTLDLTPLTGLMAKLAENYQQSQNRTNNSEMTVNFGTLKIDITGNNLGDLEAEFRKPTIRDQVTVAVRDAIKNNLGITPNTKGAPNSLNV